LRGHLGKLVALQNRDGTSLQANRSMLDPGTQLLIRPLARFAYDLADLALGDRYDEMIPSLQGVMSAAGRYCCKSLFAQVIKNFAGCRRDFRVKMGGVTRNSRATSVGRSRLHESAVGGRVEVGHADVKEGGSAANPRINSRPAPCRKDGAGNFCVAGDLNSEVEFGRVK
jgi:hypothetical protein